jgi:hypothetical protein
LTMIIKALLKSTVDLLIEKPRITLLVKKESNI